MGSGGQFAEGGGRLAQGAAVVLEGGLELIPAVGQAAQSNFPLVDSGFHPHARRLGHRLTLPFQPPAQAQALAALAVGPDETARAGLCFAGVEVEFGAREIEHIRARHRHLEGLAHQALGTVAVGEPEGDLVGAVALERERGGHVEGGPGAHSRPGIGAAGRAVRRPRYQGEIELPALAGVIPDGGGGNPAIVIESHDLEPVGREEVWVEACDVAEGLGCMEPAVGEGPGGIDLVAGVLSAYVDAEDGSDPRVGTQIEAGVWDGDLDGPALGVGLSGGGPLGAPGIACAGEHVSGGVTRYVLFAPRVGGEVIVRFPVVVQVNEELDRVGRPDRVMRLRQAVGDGFHIGLFGADRKVEGLFVEAHPGHGLAAGGFGLQQFEERRHRRGVLPAIIGQVAVNFRRRGRAPERDRRPGNRGAAFR